MNFNPETDDLLFLMEGSFIFEKLQEEICRQRLQDEYWGYPVTESVYVIPAAAGRMFPEEYRHIIYLDQHEAFGDGRHPTTSLCMEELQAVLGGMGQERKGSLRLLDAGTGTGILSILAAKLGVRSIVAFDIDRSSVENARSNASLNGCPWIRTVRSDIASFAADAPFGIIAANLLTDVIVPNLSRLCSLLDDGGTIIASGIGDMRREEAEAAFAANGLCVKERRGREGWNCYLLMKR